MQPRGATLRQLPTADLTASELSALYALFSAAWPDGGFTDDDFAHGMGGMHWLAEVDGSIVSHASVVARRLEAGDRVLRTGYLEAVATLPTAERRGYGSMVVRAAARYLLPRYELGALSTSVPGFYLRMGWEAWLGPTSVRTPHGLQRTEHDDGGIFILRTPSTPALDLAGPLACDWRSGDVW
jgi:aminoglycoside 2'-N-acetyltransferase I